MSYSYRTIGELYAVYGQKDNSKYYSNIAVAIDKQLMKNNASQAQPLIETYFQIVINNILFKQYNTASTYLDSCLYMSNALQQDTLNKCYMYAKKADLNIIKGDYNAAEKTLLQVKTVFESLDKNHPEDNKHISYLVFVYASMGDLYARLNLLTESELYYKKSLIKMDEYHAHVGYKSYVLYNLAEVYKRAGKSNEAYEAMRQSKNLYDSVYGIGSASNVKLLEMKSSYEKKLTDKDAALYVNAIQLADKDRVLNNVRVVLYSIIFMIVLGLLLIRNRNQRFRFRNKLDALLLETNLTEKANAELLEMKNKELTTYTLKFIDKDKTIKQLIDLIKEKKGANEKQLNLKSIQTGLSSWEEFNHRFNSVNTGFYERLSVQFPDLSPTELKHCALIKLNFSSKEMAHLLGLTTSSVHVSRSRLRKKLNLDRDVNLSTFMSKI